MNYLENLYWLALCIYHEARGEPYEGKLGVAHTIMNRALSREMSIKDVILQPKQFSWVNDNHPDDVQNHKAFVSCMVAASDAKNQRWDGSNFHGVDHYFADYIQPPSWSKKMTFIKKIGKHLFYRS